MQVKIRIHDILAETDKAVLLLVSEQEVWFPKSSIRWATGNYIICSKRLAEEKQLRFYPLLHIPEKIEPQYNQEPIDEIVYRTESGN